MTEEFSSPFIEERLYLDKELERYLIKEAQFSSPFIEERLYLEAEINEIFDYGVLVPFYRGAVVFKEKT